MTGIQAPAQSSIPKQLQKAIEQAHALVEAGRRCFGTHDYLVTGLGLAVMAAQRRGQLPFSWYRRDASFVASVLGNKEATRAQQGAERRRARVPVTWDEVLSAGHPRTHARACLTS